MAQELVWERSGHPQIQLLVVTITTLVPEASYPPAPMPATAGPREHCSASSSSAPSSPSGS